MQKTVCNNMAQSQNKSGLVVNPATEDKQNDIITQLIHAVTALNPVVEADQWHILRGLEYAVYKIFEGVAAGGKVYMRFVAGSDVDLHMNLEISATMAAKVTLYGGTTYTNDGTLVASSNMNSNYSNDAEAIFYHTPTINSIGSAAAEILIPAGTKKGAAGVGGLAYRVFKPSSKGLIEIENIGSQAGDYGFKFEFHEEEPGQIIHLNGD